LKRWRDFYENENGFTDCRCMTNDTDQVVSIAFAKVTTGKRAFAVLLSQIVGILMIRLHVLTNNFFLSICTEMKRNEKKQRHSSRKFKDEKQKFQTPLNTLGKTRANSCTFTAGKERKKAEQRQA
jgi:hypothetical protein